MVLTFFFVWPSDNSYGWLFDFKFRTESGWKETPVSTVWPSRSLSAPLFTSAWLQGLPASRKRQSRANRGTVHFLKLITPPARQVDDGCLDFWEVRGPSFIEYWISFISVINLKLITEAEVWPSWAKSAVSESHTWKDVSTSEAVHALLIFLERPASWQPGNISRGGSNLEPESGLFFLLCFFQRKIKDYSISVFLKVKVNPITMSSIQEKWNDRSIILSKIPRCACFFPPP